MAIKSVSFPKNISKELSFAFISREVDLTKDYSALAETAKKQLLKDSKNTGGRKTLAQNILEHSALVATVVLPIPNSFLENVSHDWGETTGLAVTAVDTALSALPGANLATKAAQQTAGNTGVRMVATDPGYFQKYQGTKTREFSFSWDFVIESEEDRNLITDLIKTFKTLSAPSQLVSNVALIAPNFWLIHIDNKYLRESLMLQPMVIKSVAVNYTGSSIMEIYRDGTPKFINLSIVCAEISAITRQTYGEDDAFSMNFYKETGEKLGNSELTPAATPTSEQTTAQ